MPFDGSNSVPPFARLLTSAALLFAIAAATAGCQTTQSTETTGSLPVAPVAAADRSDADWRRDVQVYGEKYRANPTKIDVALPYAQALRATGQRAQAVAVLERASIENPHDRAVLGAYGRALAEAGNLNQAFEVLERAHSPDQPDWHILSAQGAVLDQLGRHTEAQRYYLTALKIIPDEPSVLSNCGLSYALSRICTTPRQLCAALQRSDRWILGCGRIWLWWSACRDVSKKRRQSPALICRRRRRQPTLPICGRCSRTAKTCAIRPENMRPIDGAS